MFFSHHDFDAHENLTFVHDQKSGLRAIIAIHNTTLGAALGGCRIWQYSTEADAIRDVLRLSRGMTYKAALAGLKLGGGKSVVLLDKGQRKTPLMMRRLGEAVESLNGQYVIAEDVGATPDDMTSIAKKTSHVSGLLTTTGDPSPWTARSVFYCLKKAVELKFNKSLSETTISVKGLGAVGYALCELLYNAACQKLIVSDLDEAKVLKAVRAFKAEPCPVDTAHLQKVDVFSPCALGGDLSSETIPEIRAGIICGAANNQLATPYDDARLYHKDILYCPDYLVNAGGLINVSRSLLDMTKEEAEKKILASVDILNRVVREAIERSIPTGQIADYIARQRFMK